MKIDVWTPLMKRYPANEFALMAEVSDSAGYGRSRSADYIAVNLWPSRGLAIEGIELKSYRGDWLRELKNPKKAENIFQYCDFWWLLTTDDTIAKIEEIPETWGWLCIKNGKITVKKQAPKLAPVTVSKNFMVSMLKRASCRDGFIHRDSIEDQLTNAKKAGEEAANRQSSHRLQSLIELEKTVKEFELSSGISLSGRWPFSSGTKVGEAVKLLLAGGADALVTRLKNIQNISDDVGNSIKKILAELQ